MKDNNERVTIAIVNENELVRYDAMDREDVRKDGLYPSESWRYLGKGYVYSIDGVLLESVNTKGHFWSKKI